MVFGFKQSSYEAVLFVSQKQVLKEMLYSEFEAVLDGVVGEPEFSDETCQAVYLKIDTRLNILGAVFFLIHFDAEGNADKRWNLPLNQLVDTAAFGPELNGQLVRIACRSQCQIPWHQEHLWEPDLSVDSNTLKMLASCVRANRLGLLVEGSGSGKKASATFTSGDSTTANAVSHGSDEDIIDTEQREQERYKMAQSIKKLRLYIASLKTRHQQEIESLSAQFIHEKEALQGQLEDTAKTLQDAEQKHVELQEKNRQLDQHNTEQRKDFEKQIADQMNQQGVDFSALRKQFRQDLQKKLIEQTSELEAKLEMRDVEAHYRDEQIKRLKQELAELSSGQAGPTSQQDDLEALDKMGVNFVLALPGISPLSIPVMDISDYRSYPNAYVAGRLGVELPVYEAWLEHASHPVCNAELADDCRCGKNIDVVPPKEFVAGVTDRCAAHSTAPLNAVAG